jgi:hypothetical protein
MAKTCTGEPENRQEDSEIATLRGTVLISMRAAIVILLALVSWPMLAAAQSSATLPTSPRVFAGAYYFDGWTRASGHLKPRLLTEFADREPIWGWYDDSPDVMRQQIELAADNGIRFFAFDWYWPEAKEKKTPLNNALDLYRNAPNRSRLQFCLMVANHGGFRIGPNDWDQVSDVWLKLMAEPTHVKVDGKPLLIFFSPRELLTAFGGAEAVKVATDTLQSRARAAGLAGVSLAACCAPGPENGWIDLNDVKSAGFTLLTGYNYVGFPMKSAERIQSYRTLVGGHEEIWNRFAQKNVLPYMPCVTTGWDKRPWEDPAQPPKQPYYPDRTPPQITDFVSRAIKWMDDHPRNTTNERIVMLYAWNENGEGGYLTPTKGMGDAYLKAVRAALLAPPSP